MNKNTYSQYENIFLLNQLFRERDFRLENIQHNLLIQDFIPRDAAMEAVVDNQETDSLMMKRFTEDISMPFPGTELHFAACLDREVQECSCEDILEENRGNQRIGASLL